MEKINFSTEINAPSEKVWKVLWDHESYKKWTTPFFEGSYAKTDNWKEGSKAIFLDGNNRGMLSKIVRNIPGEYLSIQHLGELKEGTEQLESAEQKWSGFFENYILRSSGNGTELLIEMDVVDEFKEYFGDIWPKALEKVKDLAEKPSELVG